MAVDLTKCKNLTTLGNRMFYGCSAITEINCSGTNLTEIPRSRNADGSYPDRYGAEGFTEGCTSLETINFSNCKNLTTIGIGAFGTSSSDTTKQRTSLKTINFSGCTSLTAINEYAFALTPAAETVDFTDCPIQIFNEGIFYGCKAKNWVLPTEDVTVIRAEAFNAAGSDDAVAIDMNFPKLTQWGYDYHAGGMFYHCNMIKSFNMHDVTDFVASMWYYIPHRMFTQCKNLVSVDLGSVPFKYIGGSAFKDTTALKTLSFNTSKIQYIGSYPWSGEDSPADQWSENCYHAFLNAGSSDCTPIDITIDDGLLKWIYNYSFGNNSSNGCKIVKSITCHNCENLTNLRVNGITYSTSLQKIDFGGSKIASLGNVIFSLPNLQELDLGFADTYAPTAVFSNNIGSSANMTVHFSTTDQTVLENLAKTFEDSLSGTNLKFWCCSNGSTSTTTGGTSGSVSCNVNSFYTSGTLSILFDL